ncbi:MAG TPA: S26 family signal peptidase [Thermoplasmata archaeon]|nr:S26 family signal peptidase [Thermoplasmata archaeon]
MPPRAEDADERYAEPEDEESSPPPRRRSRAPPSHPPARAKPVRRWQGPEAPEEEASDDELEPDAKRLKVWQREKKPVYWRARDSLWFEPLVAVAIIVVILVGLYAYTDNWPPVYVVESQSMQHGSNDVLGVINTGDLVLAQRIPTDQITPYVTGIATGYQTYGEYGDVLLYSANGQGSTPVIHRAILYLQWNPYSNSYNATDLSGLPCGNERGAVYNYSDPDDPSASPCLTTGLVGTLTLYHIGWQSVEVTLDLGSSLLGEHSGFVTMGDNNFLPAGCTTGCSGGFPDQVDGTSTLVEPGWILGVARGMLPWFGAVKLLLEGNAGEVPAQSWQYLGLTVVGLIAVAFGIHYALRKEGIEDERRKEQEEEAAAARTAAEPESEGGGRARRWLAALRPWKRPTADDDEEAPAPRAKHAPRSSSSMSDRRRGRPVPRVKRAAKPKRRPPPDDDGAL